MKSNAFFSFIGILLLTWQATPALGNPLLNRHRDRDERIDLNLSSTTGSIPFAAKDIATIDITVGGAGRTFNIGDLMTAAEFVAVQQLLNNGSQTIILDSSGAATGGSFSFSTLDSNRYASILVPAGVTAVAPSRLNVSGALENQGNLIDDNSRSAMHLKVGSLAVGSGAFLGNNQSDLAIRSQGSIANAGTIQAQGDLLLDSATGLINNVGFIHSAKRLNLDNSSAGTLSVTNHGGTISALGAIDIRSAGFADKQNTSLLGGAISAPNINFHGGDGRVVVNVEQASGIVNVNAGLANITAAGGELTIGAMALTGDPTIINTAGDVHLTQNLIFPGQPLAILAANNITADPSVTLIDLSSKTVPGGALHIMAGYDFTPTTGGQVQDPQLFTLVGPNANGGNVVLPGVTIDISGLGSQSAFVGRIFAHDGAVADGSISVGSVLGRSAKGDGALIVIAGPGTMTINGKVDISGATTTRDLNLWGGNIGIFSTVEFQDGGIVSGLFGEPIPKEPNSTVEVAGGITAVSKKGFSANVNVEFGDDVYIGGPIIANGKFQQGFPLDVFISSDNGRVDILGGIDVHATGNKGVQISAADDITVGGAVNANRVVGAGRTIKLTSTAGEINVAGFIDNSSKKGTGSSVTLEAPDGVFVTGAISTFGANNGGAVTIKSDKFIIIGENVLRNADAGELPVAKLNGGIAAQSPNGVSGSVQLVKLNPLTSDLQVQVGGSITAFSPQSAGAVTINADRTILIAGSISTYSGTDGGAVSLIAEGGSESRPGVSVGFINANGFSDGGDVTVTSDSGQLFINGFVNAPGVNADGGNVTLTAAHDIRVNDFIEVQGNDGGDVNITSTNGGVFVKGFIGTKGLDFTGGDISITSLRGITTGGSVFTSSVTNAGDITMDSGDGGITINGNVSAAPDFNLFNTAGGHGGDIVLNDGTGSFVIVTGSVRTDGGASIGTSASTGGDGGNVTIRTMVNTFGNTPIPDRIGFISIGGGINVNGGNTDNIAANPGASGSIILESATVQVEDLIKGTSIVSFPGVDPSNQVGTQGSITISTSGAQPLTASFDLQSTKLTEAALPGGMFEIGDASVNGTQSAIVTSDVTIGDQRIMGAAFNQNTVTITPGTSSRSVDLAGTITTLNTLSDPLDPNSPRLMVTPSVSLALWQVSRDSGPNAQTFETTPEGTASDSVVNFAGGPNFIRIPAYEFGRQFTAFNIATGIPNNRQGILVQVAVSDLHPGTYITLPAKGIINIEGMLQFFDVNNGFGGPKFATMQFGKTPITVASTGHLIADGLSDPDDIRLTLLEIGKVGTLNINGELAAGRLILANTSGGITVNMGGGALLNGPTAGGDGILEAVAGYGAVPTGSFVVQNAKNAINTVIDDLDIYAFANGVTVGRNLKGTPVGPDLNTSQIETIMSTGAVSLNSSGSINFSSSATIDANGAISILAGGGIDASSANRLASTSSISITALDSISLSGNILPATFGFISGDNVSFDPGTVISTGSGSLQIIALNGDATLGDGNSFNATNGNLSILASGNVIGGAAQVGVPGNLFSASGVKNGGVEIKSGSTISTLATQIKARPTPPSVTAPAGVTVNALGTKGTVLFAGPGLTMNTTQGNSIVNSFNGVVWVEAVGASSLTMDSANFSSFIQVSNTDMDMDMDEAEAFWVNTDEDAGAE